MMALLRYCSVGKTMWPSGLEVQYSAFPSLIDILQLYILESTCSGNACLFVLIK